ncbi:MAG: META domain-containing protein [Candidatus Limnocylindrales bacterium]
MTRIRTVTTTLAAVALSIGLISSAVAQDDAEPELVGVYDIEGLTWLLTSQVVDGEMTPLRDGVLVSLRMEGGDAGGSGGCNSYFTSYELDGFDLAFGPVGSTMMACLPPLMEAEQAYFANLSEVAAYQSGGIQMALLDAEGGFLLEFELAPETTVVGSWVATGINNGNEAVVTTEITAEITADFSADGDLTGFDGCNGYFTSYVVDGESFTVDPAIGQTMMACPSEEHAEQAQAYIAALTNATTWSVDAAGNLELRDEDGALQVGFAPAE